MRVTKVLGTVYAFAEELAWTCCVQCRGPEHHGLVPLVAKAVKVAGALAVYSGEPSHCRSKSSPPSVSFGLAAQPGKWHMSVCELGGLCDQCLQCVMFTGQILSVA